MNNEYKYLVFFLLECFGVVHKKPLSGVPPKDKFKFLFAVRQLE